MEGAQALSMAITRRWQTPLIIVLVAAVYLAAAEFGLSLGVLDKQVTAVWPPTGIALAAILLLGWRAWPGITLGAFIANFQKDQSWTAAGIAMGNTLEAVIGASVPFWVRLRVIPA